VFGAPVLNTPSIVSEPVKNIEPVISLLSFKSFPKKR
jgi:hypothetical protein